jgi:tetratricopeptide (TPR) repeat protein
VWALCVLAGVTMPLTAQTLTPKRLLTTGPAAGCDVPVAGQGAIARRDNAEARRLAAAGQEAALVGDQAAARDAFARAAVLNPGDERVAYDLARAHEELAESEKAIGEYCRYLTLSPTGRESVDVRERLVRLVPQPVQQRAQDVQVAFRLGLALFDDARYDASARAFNDVVKLSPVAAEGFYNRGLARAALGKRAEALQDLEQYRAAAPTVDDRVEIGRAIETLRRPVFRSAVAFSRGILPGFGQLYTARPLRGLVVLAGVAGAAGFAFTTSNTTTAVNYVDPNGVPAPYTVRTTERSYAITGLAVAAGVTLVSAIEAAWFAARSQRGAAIVAKRSAGSRPIPSTGDLSVRLAPTLGRDGAVGMRVSAHF